MFKINATKNDEGRILFKVVIGYLNNVPISRIEKLFREKDIKLNGERNLPKNTIIKENDEILIYGIEAGKSTVKYQRSNEVRFKVIFEDKNVLIIDKPDRTVMHSEKNSLDEQVLTYLKFHKIDSFVPASIGRLDKGATGIVVYAKNAQTLRVLKAENNIEKYYMYMSDIAVVEPREVAFFHDYNPIKQRVVLTTEETKLSKPCSTYLYDEGNYHFAKLITGRKHQIRATLSKLGYPIYGDRNYGGKPWKRLALHSFKIKFSGLEGDLAYLNENEFLSYPKW